jgi:hypothetical protein
MGSRGNAVRLTRTIRLATAFAARQRWLVHNTIAPGEIIFFVFYACIPRQTASLVSFVGYGQLRS